MEPCRYVQGKCNFFKKITRIYCASFKKINSILAVFKMSFHFLLKHIVNSALCIFKHYLLKSFSLQLYSASSTLSFYSILSVYRLRGIWFVFTALGRIHHDSNRSIATAAVYNILTIVTIPKIWWQKIEWNELYKKSFRLNELAPHTSRFKVIL